MALTTIQKWGNSHGIRIPKHLLDSLNWSVGEKISLYTRGNRLIIEQTPKQRKTIEELLDGFNSDNFQSSEFDWGKPAGREVW